MLEALTDPGHERRAESSPRKSIHPLQALDATYQ